MTKMNIVAAALVAAAAYAAEPSDARSNAAARHTQPAVASNVASCVRAPSVGAYASAPYSVPPCMPNAAN